jgi:hypothetical protein
MRTDDWCKLSVGEKLKVENLAANNWSDIRVYIENGKNKAHKYGSLLVKFVLNGKEFQSMIPAHCSGYHKRKKNDC